MADAAATTAVAATAVLSSLERRMPGALVPAVTFTDAFALRWVNRPLFTIMAALGQPSGDIGAHLCGRAVCRSLAFQYSHDTCVQL